MLNFTSNDEQVWNKNFSMIDLLLSRKTSDRPTISAINLFSSHGTSENRITGLMILDQKNKPMLTDGPPIVSYPNKSFFQLMGGESYAEMFLLHFFIDKISYLLKGLNERIPPYQNAPDSKAKVVELLLKYGAIFDKEFNGLRDPQPNINQPPYVYEMQLVKFIAPDEKSPLWIANYLEKPESKQKKYWHKIPIQFNEDGVWEKNLAIFPLTNSSFEEKDLLHALGFTSAESPSDEVIQNRMGIKSDSKVVITSQTDFGKWKYSSTEVFQVYDYIMALYLNDFYPWTVSQWYQFLT